MTGVFQDRSGGDTVFRHITVTNVARVVVAEENTVCMPEMRMYTHDTG